MHQMLTVITILICVGALLGACADNSQPAQATQIINSESTVIPENTTQPSAGSTDGSTSGTDSIVFPLPERSGPRTRTSGTVPHVQIGVGPVTAVNDELYRRVFALPGVEKRPTTVSLPGATGMWLSDDMALAHPEAIVGGREFAHIHPDGSLHAPLPYERALEVAETGWGERHPWADDREGWDGFVMIFTPQSMDELDVIFQLIVESYNYVTGQAVLASDFE